MQSRHTRQTTVLEFSILQQYELLGYLRNYLCSPFELSRCAKTARLHCSATALPRPGTLCLQTTPSTNHHHPHTHFLPAKQTCSLAHPRTLKLDFLSKINTRHSERLPSCASMAQRPVAPVLGLPSSACLPAPLRDSLCFLACSLSCLSLYLSTNNYKSPIKSLKGSPSVDPDPCITALTGYSSCIKPRPPPSSQTRPRASWSKRPLTFPVIIVLLTPPSRCPDTPYIPSPSWLPTSSPLSSQFPSGEAWRAVIPS